MQFATRKLCNAIERVYIMPYNNHEHVTRVADILIFQIN